MLSRKQLPFPPSLGFTAVESLVMLAVLFVFGMLTLALFFRYQEHPESMGFPFQLGQGAAKVPVQQSIEGS